MIFCTIFTALESVQIKMETNELDLTILRFANRGQLRPDGIS